MRPKAFAKFIFRGREGMLGGAKRAEDAVQQLRIEKLITSGSRERGIYLAGPNSAEGIDGAPHGSLAMETHGYEAVDSRLVSFVGQW